MGITDTLPGGANGKESTCQCRRHKRCRFHPWVQKILWKRACQTTTMYLPEESHGQRCLLSYSPQGPKESYMTEVTKHIEISKNEKKKKSNTNNLTRSHKFYAKEVVQFSSVAQSCPTLCDPMGCSMSGFSVHHQLPELTQTYVNRVSDDIQPSHPLSPVLFLPSVFPSIRVFSNEAALWPKY